MKAQIRWVDGAMFLGSSGSGHSVVMDGPPEAGGRNLGIRPMEMLLLGMGACMAFDVVHILRKGRHPIEACGVELQAERAEREPKVFTKVHLHFTAKGRGLGAEALERAITLSHEKYCSASIMLGKTAQISHSHEIVTS